jgi:hypothetical protein
LSRDKVAIADAGGGYIRVEHLPPKDGQRRLLLVDCTEIGTPTGRALKLETDHKIEGLQGLLGNMPFECLDVGVWLDPAYFYPEGYCTVCTGWIGEAQGYFCSLCNRKVHDSQDCRKKVNGRPVCFVCLRGKEIVEVYRRTVSLLSSLQFFDREELYVELSSMLDAVGVGSWSLLSRAQARLFGRLYNVLENKVNTNKLTGLPPAQDPDVWKVHDSPFVTFNPRGGGNAETKEG